MKKLLNTLSIIAIIIAANGCRKGDHFPTSTTLDDSKVATDWYRLQLRFLLERNGTMNGVYFGYLGIGLYESVRCGIPFSASFSTKLYQMPDMPSAEHNKSYHWDVSANAAMAAMVRAFNGALTPAESASVDSLEKVYNDRLQLKINDDGFARSQAFGRSIASAIYDWSKTDNFNPTNAGYVAPVFPGAWVPTPPAFVNPPANPYISQARPFLVEDLTMVAAPPTHFSEDTHSDFYKMVKNVYDVSRSLTTEQKNIALFWVDQGNGLGYTPDGHNQLVVTEALEQAKVNLATAAEAYAKTGIAERESNIVCFRGKYKYNVLRPVTYIRKIIDTSWTPFIVTPPFPEYPAAHAYVTAAVMQSLHVVLTDYDKVTDHAYDFRGWSSRRYTTLFDVAKEAGISRLYGGIHYLPSINAGLSLGKDMGDDIGNINLHDFTGPK